MLILLCICSLTDIPGTRLIDSSRVDFSAVKSFSNSAKITSSTAADN